MGNFFWSICTLYGLYRLSPSAAAVCVLGWCHRLRWRLGLGNLSFGVNTRMGGSKEIPSSSSNRSLQLSGGTSAVPSVSNSLKPRTRGRIAVFWSRVRAPFDRWRTRQRKRYLERIAYAKWLSWVAQNLYDDQPRVRVSFPKPTHSSKRNRRVSGLWTKTRASQSTAPR